MQEIEFDRIEKSKKRNPYRNHKSEMDEEEMMRIETFSAEETYALGKKLGSEANPGDVLTLIGDLGVGKTVFTQGFAAGLGIEGPVNSPTPARYTSRSSVPMIPRFLIRQPLPSYRQHHRPVQTRRRFPRPSPPVHGISR